MDKESGRSRDSPSYRVRMTESRENFQQSACAGTHSYAEQLDWRNAHTVGHSDHHP